MESMKNKQPLEILAHWMREREVIRLKRARNLPPPWTDDLILGTYRFTNVHREDDKVTRWIKHNWRDPHMNDPHLWHAMLIARYINWPDSLQVMGYPEPWPQARNRIRSVLLHRETNGYKVFTGAYIVSTNGAPVSKITYVLDLFDRSFKLKQPPIPGDTLAAAHAKLMTINGVGSFMAAQIVADLKHTPVLRGAPDWKNWAAPGPGSLRGLSRVRGLGTASRWRTDAFIPELITLRKELKPLTGAKLCASLCLQDLQNCLCEFDKYMRVLYGQGKPRAKYTPST